MVKICILFIVAVFVCTTASCAWASTNAQNPSQASAVSGIWKKSHGKWWYAYNSKTITVQKKSYPANEWVSIGGKKYHFNSAGYMHAGWQKLNNQWYYFGSDGAMKTGWKKVKGNWYYLGVDGKMRTGSYAVGKTQYYSSSSGVMKTGWQKLNGKWYYFAKSGAMQTNKWISGKYWVGSNGVMATNAWVDNGRYYVGSNGAWVGQAKQSQQKLLEQQEISQKRQQEAERFAKEYQRQQLYSYYLSLGYQPYVINALLRSQGL